MYLVQGKDSKSEEATAVLNAGDSDIVSIAIRTAVSDCPMCVRDYPHYSTFCQACAFKAANIVLDYEYNCARDYYMELVNGT